MPTHGVAIPLASQQAQPLGSQQQAGMFVVDPVFFVYSLTN
jgi:hypothetical protein